MSNIILFSVVMVIGLVIIFGSKSLSKTPYTSWDHNLIQIQVRIFKKSFNAYQLWILIGGIIFFLFGLICLLNELKVI